MLLILMRIKIFNRAIPTEQRGLGEYFKVYRVRLSKKKNSLGSKMSKAYTSKVRKTTRHYFIIQIWLQGNAEYFSIIIWHFTYRKVIVLPSKRSLNVVVTQQMC